MRVVKIRILHANDWNFCKNRIKYGYMINVRQAIAEDKKDVLSLLDEFLTHIEESKDMVAMSQQKL